MQANTASSTVSTIISLVAPSVIKYTIEQLAFYTFGWVTLPTFPVLALVSLVVWILYPYWVHSDLTNSQKTGRFTCLAVGFAYMIIRSN